MNSIRFLRKLCVALTMAVITAGCNGEQHRADQQKKVIDQSEELFRDYLQGDVNRARESLLKNAILLESATFLEPSGRAQILSKTYSRLHVLEKRSGNEAAAEANLIKERYWLLTYGELTGVEPKDAISQINENSVHIVDVVDRSDRKQNDGKAARYAQTIDLDSAQKGQETAPK